MSDFEPYEAPGPARSVPGHPDDRYVLVITTALNQGMRQPAPVSEPMTWDEARAVLDDIIAGRSTRYLDVTGDLIAELAPGHLVVATNGSMLSKANVHEVRMARVLGTS